ncbi:hypothetical protein AVEN_159387-1 [Araneus ventricosus]|uniref:Uncharacterized protein n=1 Tax=Araneus ventricosus TaxID=182803 RepID=A0A4Y2A302_ARAVE|nr:hypothetical protein AVEN_159387-1 [Araneus ventricosus]
MQNLPKCIVYDLEPDFTKEQTTAALSQSFGDAHKDLKVLFPIKQCTSETHWVLQTPVNTYRQLRRRQKLTNDWETQHSKNAYPRFKAAYGGHKRMLQHFSQNPKQLEQQIEKSNTKDHLVKPTEKLQNAILASC